jgi:hypothetical protein
MLRNRLLTLALLIQYSLNAQDLDLNQLMQADIKKDSIRPALAQGIFHTTRLINGHSIENIDKGILDLKIAHRFGKISDGIYSLFGLDNASMRIGLDYGLTDKLMIGIGRSTFQKQLDGFIKYKLLAQNEKDAIMPISVSYASSVMVNTLKWGNPDRKNYFTSRLYYAHQLLIARKFSKHTSFQLMPTIVHYNLVQSSEDPNDLFSIGIGARQRITRRISINTEYYYQLPGSQFINARNSLSLGFDIETGGHVFQLHITNSQGMTERTFINETYGGWDQGDLLFGFNISRVFSLKKKRSSW